MNPYTDEEGVTHEYCASILRKSYVEGWEGLPCCTCFPHTDCDLIPSGQEVTQEAQREIAREEIRSLTDY